MFRILQRITIIKCTAFDLFPFVVFLFIAKSQSLSYFCLQLSLIYFDASWHEPLFPKIQMYFMGAKMQQPNRDRNMMAHLIQFGIAEHAFKMKMALQMLSG